MSKVDQENASLLIEKWQKANPVDSSDHMAAWSQHVLYGTLSVKSTAIVYQGYE